MEISVQEIIKKVENSDIKSHIDSLKIKYADKKIVLYGDGTLSRYILEKYDFSGLNIVGISDKSFYIEERDTLKFKPILPHEIPKTQADIILVMTYDLSVVANYLNRYLDKNYSYQRIHILPDSLSPEVILEEPLPPPSNFCVEITNQCNLKCSMCLSQRFHSESLASKMIPPFMTPAFFKSLIDQIAEFSPGANIYLVFNGEALVHPLFIDFCKYIDQKKLKFSFTTNAMLFNENIQKALLDLEGFSLIQFSLDGFSKEVYEKIRIGAKYETVIKHINSFIELSKKREKKVDIGINFVLQKENKHQMEDFIQHWVDKSDIVNFFYKCDENFDLTNYNFFPKRYPCDILYSSMCILANGQIVPCCIDFLHKLDLGNVNRTSLDEIWKSAAYEDLRQMDRTGDWANHSVCGKCHLWSSGAVKEKQIDEKRRLIYQEAPYGYIYSRST
jgi:radical SAM protein with 4Fe4S-binding SPASM domain